MCPNKKTLFKHAVLTERMKSSNLLNSHEIHMYQLTYNKTIDHGLEVDVPRNEIAQCCSQMPELLAYPPVPKCQLQYAQL